MSEEFRQELEKFVEEVRSRVEELVKKVEELGSRGDYYRAYKTWSGGITEILRGMRESLEKLNSMAKESRLSEEEVKNSIEYLKKSLEEILDKVDYMNDKLREYRKKGFEVYVGFTPERVFHDVFKGIEGSIEGIIEGVGKVIDSIEESLTTTISRTTQVVSVRLKERDLDIIDQLVEAGIFKSRSEAVAYFAKKGIETSREWINRALEQAKKIRELQDLIRKELKGEDEESKDKT